MSSNDGSERFHILQRKVLSVGKLSIILHIFVGIGTYTLYHLHYFDSEIWIIIWIMFLVPMKLLYFGARRRKKYCLIPFMIIVALLIFILSYFSIICLITGFELLNSSLLEENNKFINIFCIALVVAVNIVLLWVLRTISTFYFLLEQHASIRLSYVHYDLNREEQISTVHIDDEIV